MSFIRQRRHTSTTTAQTDCVVSPQSMFNMRNQAVTAKSWEQKLHAFLLDFESRLPKAMPHDEKRASIQDIGRCLTQMRPHFDPFSGNAKMNELTGKLREELKKGNPADAYSTTTFIKQLTSSTVTALLDSYIPGIGFGLSLIASAAAQGMDSTAANNYEVHGGVPPGGQNLCGGKNGYLQKCVQGYLTQGNSSWTLDDPQFNTIVQSGSNSQASELGAWLTLEKCVNANTAGNVVKGIMGPNPTNSTVTCSAESTLWLGWQVSGTATNLPDTVNACENFQGGFGAAASACMSNASRWKWDGIIAGSIIGGIAVIAALCAVGFCCLKDSDCACDCSPC